MQKGIGYYLLIILLVLMLFGVVSLADVFNLVFVIIGVLLLLVVGGVVAFRIYVARLRKKAERGDTYTFFWTNHTGGGRTTSGGSAGRPSGAGREGEVKIKRTSPQPRKKVNDKVGDYVDFEDVDFEK